MTAGFTVNFKFTVICYMILQALITGNTVKADLQYVTTVHVIKLMYEDDSFLKYSTM
jgi:hypothetical protein